MSKARKTAFRALLRCAVGSFLEGDALGVFDVAVFRRADLLREALCSLWQVKQGTVSPSAASGRECACGRRSFGSGPSWGRGRRGRIPRPGRVLLRRVAFRAGNVLMVRFGGHGRGRPHGLGHGAKGDPRPDRAPPHHGFPGHPASEGGKRGRGLYQTSAGKP